MAMIFFLPYLAIAAETVWQIFIKYPPTPDQLNLGIDKPFELWISRFLSAVLIAIASSIFFKSLPSKIKKYSWITILAIPTLSFIAMSHPLDALKILFASLVFHFVKRRQNLWQVSIISLLGVLIVNLLVFKEKPKITEIFSLEKSQQEVTYRFVAEDRIDHGVKLPLFFRRTGYNKYFIALKNSLNEGLTFFDPETLFFQEVHPLGQKGFVMFYWPQVFIFTLGLWWVLTGKVKSEKAIIPLLFISFAYFLTSNATPERRLILTIYPLTIVMSAFLKQALSKKNRLRRMVVVPLIVLTLYGWATNYFDRSVRPAYWLDNRPLAYEFIFSYLKTHPPEYSKILIPDTLYAAKDYCPYYLNECPAFEIKNFNLNDEGAGKDTLYIGFIGNFTGPNRENSFPQDPSGVVSEKGLVLFQSTHILNNIASGWGQELVIAGPKQ